jgi:hypothetical protein
MTSSIVSLHRPVQTVTAASPESNSDAEALLRAQRVVVETFVGKFVEAAISNDRREMLAIAGEDKLAYALAIVSLADENESTTQIERMKSANNAALRVNWADIHRRVEASKQNIGSIEVEAERLHSAAARAAAVKARAAELQNFKVRAHGLHEMKIFLSSTALQTVVELVPDRVNKSNLLFLARREYWMDRFPKENKEGEIIVDWEQAASEIIDECRRQKNFHPDRIRGRGAWKERLADGKFRFVFNTGEALLINGARVEFNEYVGEFFYTASPFAVAVADDCLSHAERQELLRVLRTSFRWAAPHHPHLVAGWLLMSTVAGALDWRPMAWLTAEAGAGKTFFVETFIGFLLGNLPAFFNSSTTDKGITGTIRDDSVPFIFDEAETADEASKARLQITLRALRSAASASRGMRAVGSPGGQARLTRLNSPGFFASINNPIADPADEQRFIEPKLLAPNSDLSQAADIAAIEKATREYIDNTLTPQFAARFIALGVRNYEAIVKTISAFADVLSVDLGNRRFGLHHGTIYGCAFFFERGEVPAGEDEIRSWLANHAIENTMMVDPSNVQTALQQVLTNLLNTRVETNSGRFSISDLIRAAIVPGAAGDKLTRDAARKTLATRGIKIDEDGKRIRFARKHSGLISIFEKTPHGKTSFDVLATLETPEDQELLKRGALKRTTYIGGGTYSVVIVPVERIIAIDGDDSAVRVDAEALSAAGDAMLNRILALKIWVRTSEGRPEPFSIRFLLHAAWHRDGSVAPVRVTREDAAWALAGVGILKDGPLSITIAAAHPQLAHLLSREAGEVGKNYAEALRPLIREHRGIMPFAGIEYEAFGVSDPVQYPQ